MEIQYLTPIFGADPEFFFANKDGEVVGAEKILPKEGIRETWKEMRWDSTAVIEHTGNKLVIIDGVQAELNIPPATCRQTFSLGITTCFQLIEKQMKDKGVKPIFDQTVEITTEEMKSLSKEAQQFGCAPSFNSYTKNGIAIKDASNYFKRSAGGHIHLGHGTNALLSQTLKNHAETVKILDVILGNTCVLLDRDEGNIERRKVYGRAGEYRTPTHGLEYRTLSNFWLKSYQLTSFVLALTRFAVCVASTPALSKEILDSVDMEQIQRAINENDFELAYKNFNAIKHIIAQTGAIGNNGNIWFPLEAERLNMFEFLVEKGIDNFFKKDPMTHWLSNPRHTDVGWEGFLESTIAPMMKANSKVEPVPVASNQIQYAS